MATEMPSKMFWRSAVAFVMCVTLSLAAGLLMNYLEDGEWNDIDWLGLLAMALFPLIFPSLVIFIAYFLLYPRLKAVMANTLLVSTIFFAAMLLVLFLTELTSATFTIERYLRNNFYFIIFSFFTAISVPLIYLRTSVAVKSAQSPQT